MNLAIILGQSEYHEDLELPACKNDLNAIYEILNATNKYEEILKIDDEYKTLDDIQNSITKFIEKYKTENIEECFLYFTGHGKVDELGFYYLCNDYEEMNYPQGMLSNTQIDDIIRTLGPKIYVKLIDACHSGIEYIKSVDEPNYNIDSNKQEFESCYFLFSCKKEQSSYIPQNEKFSRFTKSFITALKNESSNNIRYTNIISYLSNAFKDDNRQKPIFVAQGTWSDIFYTKNDDVEKILSSIFDISTFSSTPKISKVPSLMELIKEDSKRYISFSDVELLFHNLKDYLEKIEISNDLLEIFTKEIETINNYQSIPNISSIANWVTDIDEDLLVDIHRKKVEYQTSLRNNIFGSSMQAILAPLSSMYTSGNYNDGETVKRVRYDPDYIISKINLPYCAIYINLRSNYPNILNTSYCFVPVLSRTNIFIFSAKIDYERKNWDEQTRKIYNYKWDCKEFDFSIDQIINYISDILNKNLFQAVSNELISRFLTKK